jgi:hypothetical protein
MLFYALFIETYTVELGYKDLSLCNTSAIVWYILWY